LQFLLALGKTKDIIRHYEEWRYAPFGVDPEGVHGEDFPGKTFHEWRRGANCNGNVLQIEKKSC